MQWTPNSTGTAGTLRLTWAELGRAAVLLSAATRGETPPDHTLLRITDDTGRVISGPLRLHLRLADGHDPADLADNITTTITDDPFA